MYTILMLLLVIVSQIYISNNVSSSITKYIIYLILSLLFIITYKSQQINNLIN